MSSQSEAHPSLPDLVNVTSNGATTPVVPAPNPFDIESLRLPQDFSALLGLQPLLTTVAVRKPSKEWWVRVHPDAQYHLPTALIALKDSGERGETYLVAPHLWPQLQEESTFAPHQLFTTINRQQEVFLWPIRMPGLDGKRDAWSESAYNAAQEAQSAWVRIQSRRQGGGYIVLRSGYTDSPQWPTVSLQDLIDIAFRDHMIASWDHPVLQRLRGEH